MNTHMSLKYYFNVTGFVSLLLQSTETMGHSSPCWSRGEKRSSHCSTSHFDDYESHESGPSQSKRRHRASPHRQVFNFQNHMYKTIRFACQTTNCSSSMVKLKVAQCISTTNKWCAIACCENCMKT
jgi:hypothetical protein